MNRQEILLPHDKEKVYIPNEIFTDFNKNEQITAKNIAFLYTFYCVIAYLFRYCKYGQSTTFINNEIIKQVLGYAKGYVGIDYLIKKGGLLDQTGYTNTIRDFPLQYIFDDKHRWVEFEMYSQLDQEFKVTLNMPRNFSIKCPVKAFYRHHDSREDGVYDGTFYDISNTHEFNIQILIDMINSEIGLPGFYIYQYLKHKNDLFKNGFNIGYIQLAGEIKLGRRTIIDYIKALEENGYIRIVRDQIKGKNTDANTYRIIEF